MSTLLNVKDFNAKGDAHNYPNCSSDYEAFKEALSAAQKIRERGVVVYVPEGVYLIDGPLTIPGGVTLQGCWQMKNTNSYYGTYLLATHGAGNSGYEGEALLTLGGVPGEPNADAAVGGLSIFYPNQKIDPDTGEPTRYPWTIYAKAANATIVDCLLVNPFQGVLVCAGQHHIRGLYGQPLYRGIQVQYSNDVGRIEDVHFWPFWKNTEEVRKFMSAHGEGFVFERSDWQQAVNCFCLGYRIGYHFMYNARGVPDGGATTGTFVNIASDSSARAVWVEKCVPSGGLMITNGLFVGDLLVGPDAYGHVNLVNCSFLGNPSRNATIQGGTTVFSACNFYDWDECSIRADGGRLTVNGCVFQKHGTVLEATGSVEGLIFTGNQCMLNGTQRSVAKLSSALAPRLAAVGLNVNLSRKLVS